MNLSTYSILKNARSKNRIEITGDILKRMQSLLLQTLKDFSNVCERHGYYYSLCGGSALGAVGTAPALSLCSSSPSSCSSSPSQTKRNNN